MIPKKIHYCWFGKTELPLLYQKCIRTWQEKLPDFEIVKWDESNTLFDTPFLKSALQKRQWAFVSDYVRMRALYEYGGIYLDADIEIIRDLSPLLSNDCFLGYEANNRMNTGVLGAIKSHPFTLRCMEIIDSRHAKGLPYLIAPEVAYRAHEDSSPDERITVLSQEHFYPYNPYDPERPLNNFMFVDVTDNTFAVHHWGKQWKQSLIQRVLKKFFS